MTTTTNTAAYNAGLRARAKTNAAAKKTAHAAGDAAKYFGGAVKFAALSAGGFIKAFATQKPLPEIELEPEPTVTLTESQLRAIVEAEVKRVARAKARKARK